jgi:hypothetical protein
MEVDTEIAGFVMLKIGKVGVVFARAEGLDYCGIEDCGKSGHGKWTLEKIFE